MSEQDQRDRNDGRADRMDDLEVRGDEAREVAGGKKAEKKGVMASKKGAANAVRSHGKES